MNVDLIIFVAIWFPRCARDFGESFGRDFRKRDFGKIC